MSTARNYSDQILNRSRDIRVMESIDRYVKRAALRDITVGVATTAADTAVSVIRQSYGLGLRQQFMAVRKLAALWRAVVKNVKAKHEDHPISEIHIHAVLLARHQEIARTYPTTFKSALSDADRMYLMASSTRDWVHRVNTVLDHYF